MNPPSENVTLAIATVIGGFLFAVILEYLKNEISPRRFWAIISSFLIATMLIVLNLFYGFRATSFVAIVMLVAGILILIARRVGILSYIGTLSRSRQYAIRTPPGIEQKAPETLIDEAKAFEISWLIMTLITGARHPLAVQQQIQLYLRDLGIVLDQPIGAFIKSR